MILDAFHFRGITERRGTILQVHEDTFKWVWKTSKSKEEFRWDNSKEWLELGLGESKSEFDLGFFL